MAANAGKTRTRRGKGKDVAAGGGGAVDIAAILDRRRLGAFEIPLANVAFTDLCRQVNGRVVEEIKEKISMVGWMPTALPQVTIPGLPADEEMTSDLAATLKAFVLDGNHRLNAAKEFFKDDPSKTVTCQCYREIENTFTKKIIADACNDVQATFSKKTTYDNVFFYSTMTTEVLKRRTTTSRSRHNDVKSPELRACWDEVGGRGTPSDTSLRQWLEILKSFSSEAMATLKKMTEAGLTGFERITKKFLSGVEFRNLSGKPLEQALVLEIYARYPKGTTKIDLPTVFKQAKDVANWIKGIEFIVPKDQWSVKLRGKIDEFGFEKIGHYPTYIKPHMADIAATLQTLEKGLPAHAPTLDPDTALLVQAQPLMQIRSTLVEDANLRTFLETYEKRYEEAKNTINALKLQIVPPTAHGGKTAEKSREDDEEDKDDGDGDDDNAKRALIRCALCKPPATARYTCITCKAIHIGDCAGAKTIGDDELSKDRACVDCTKTKNGAGAKRQQGVQSEDSEGEPSSPSRKRASKKGKKKNTGATPGSSSTLPLLPSSTGSDGGVKVLRREENTCLHEAMPLAPNFPDHFPNLKLKQRAMLVFISLNHPNYAHLLQETSTMSTFLKRLLYYIGTEMVHPKGTMIVSLPIPYFKHASRIAEFLQQPGLGLVVEDYGLMVEYGSRGGGLTAEMKKKHISGCFDYYLIAHTNATKGGGSTFTCNEKVTPQVFLGRQHVAPKALSPSETTPRISHCLMHDVPYKGQQRAFHNNVARFGILRFTNQGDSVVTFSAESDGVIEEALDLGRKVELFVGTGGDAHEDVARRVESAWETPWREGKFARDISRNSVTCIGPGSLPKDIPVDTTPGRVVREVGANPSPEELLRQANNLAAIFGWQLKMNESENVRCLHAFEGRGYVSASADIPIWGKPVIFDTRQDALDSLNPEKDGVDLQFVRLVLVADYHLLKRMCVPAKEVVTSAQAALYIEVSPTCPAFYAMWDEKRANRAHELCSNLKRSWMRDALVKHFQDGAGGMAAPLKIQLCKPIEGSPGVGPMVKVHPGVTVVRRGWCDEDDVDADEEPGAAGAKGAAGAAGATRSVDSVATAEEAEGGGEG